ncbi:MAG TPA: polysaccharide deacetylase family protein [Tepidisphaeraceae bacterium]
MKRFVVISLAALATFLAIGYFLSGPTRWIAFTAFWLVYLTTIGLGVWFIRLGMFCPVIWRSPAGNKSVALTFDDGPDPTTTPLLLDYLREQRIRATFFCIGKNVDAYPDIARRIVEEGHLIGNHTYHHHWWTSLMWAGSLSREILGTQEAIQRATGVRPRYVRPPMGMTNPHFARVLDRANMQMIGWDVRSLDTRKPADQVIDRVLNQARDGSIVLLHDGAVRADHLMPIVRGVVGRLRAKGFAFDRITVSSSESGEPE